MKQETDAGRYVCMAENAAARTSKELILRVQGQFSDS